MGQIIDTLKDLFLSEEARVVTQKAFWKDIHGLTYVLIQHIIIAFSIYGLQNYYGMENAPEHVPFWLMASANMLVAVLGSTQCFDVTMLVELVIALFFAIAYRFYLFFPIILAMMIQTCRRLEQTFGDRGLGDHEGVNGDADDGDDRSRREESRQRNRRQGNKPQR